MIAREALTLDGGTRTCVRILVVDDFEPWHRFVRWVLEKEPSLEIVGDVFDGPEAIQKVQELHPDLILLDVGLPTLNGIETSRQIRMTSPDSIILFASAHRNPGIVEEALLAGASGFIIKANAHRELLPAINTAVKGRRFVGSDVLNPVERHSTGYGVVGEKEPEGGAGHKVAFYSNEASLLDDVAHFIGTALVAGNAAVCVMTREHRQALSKRLQDRGLDTPFATREQQYVALDAHEALDAIIRRNGMPDEARFFRVWNDLIQSVVAPRKGAGRIAVFGECGDLLLLEGNLDGLLQFEKLGDRLLAHDLDILCGYSLRTITASLNPGNVQRICDEHSAAYFR